MKGIHRIELSSASLRNREGVSRCLSPLFLKNSSNIEVKRIATMAMGKIGTPAKDALLELYNLYRNEKYIIVKVTFLQAMLRIDPSNRKYQKIMIEDILPHPFIVKKPHTFASIYANYIKPAILRTIGEIAGKEAAGEKLDFDGNMWTMLEWWKDSGSVNQ